MLYRHIKEGLFDNSKYKNTNIIVPIMTLEKNLQ